MNLGDWSHTVSMGKSKRGEWVISSSKKTMKNKKRKRREDQTKPGILPFIFIRSNLKLPENSLNLSKQTVFTKSSLPFQHPSQDLPCHRTWRTLWKGSWCPQGTAGRGEWGGRSGEADGAERSRRHLRHLSQPCGRRAHSARFLWKERG